MRQEHLEHPADVLAVAAGRLRRGDPVALAVVTAIEGGSARPRGTLVAFDGQGGMFGYVSNGCIDADLCAQAERALDTGRVRALRYGAGSPFFDLRLPCGGAIELVIDPAPDPVAIAAASRALENREPCVLRVSAERGVCGSAPVAEGLAFTYRPRPRLALAGRGAVMRAAAHQAKLLGMELLIASPDEADLAALAGLAPVVSRHLTRPEAGADLPCDGDTAMLLLFHDHEWETALLARAIASDAPYIGALGSRETHAKRRVALLEAGISPGAIARVRGPIGLVPSLRNASQIAVSAFAEIIAAMRAATEARPHEQAAVPRPAPASVQLRVS